MSVLGNNRREKTYVGLFQGNFTLKVPEGTEKAITRVNKNGKTIHEIQFTSLSGVLSDIIEKDGEFGKAYQFVISDKDESVVLETGVNSAIASAIINRLPNIDLLSPVEIVSSYSAAKEKTYFSVYQGSSDEGIKDYFQTWDEITGWTQHHGFPVWEKIMLNGEEKWDASKQIAFQKKIVNKYFGFENRMEAPAPAPVEPEQKMPDQELYDIVADPINKKPQEVPMPTQEPNDLPWG